MESISVKGLSYSYTMLAQTELPQNILNHALNHAHLTRAITVPKLVTILDKVNFSLEKGDVFCISGKSGDGKTSLLRLIAGLEKAQSGEISLFGEPIKKNEWNALSMAQKGIGFVFQNNALISDLTVKENITTPLRYNKMGSEEEIEQKVNRALLLMLVSGSANEYPFSLSLGMRKRVAIARSWALDAKILLLDEPTAGLDKSSRVNLLSLLENLRELYKTTIIMVTNDLPIARDLNGKISFILDKKLTNPMQYDDIRNCDDERIRAMLL
jgi:phospholipid/cholesterol/gamma-HCH transport system ATP-binding protein